MTVKVLELRPNQQFINPEFNGYKLSLEPVHILKNKLDVPIDRIFPDSSQYSFLHARLIGLHNHLVGETLDETVIVYVIDESWCIKKIIINDDPEKEVEIITVLNITKDRNRIGSDYNVCLKLISDSLAVFSDGMGKLRILKTDNRKQSNDWTCLFSADILDNNKTFIIQDARFHISNGVKQIHCLLYNIEQRNEDQKFVSILYWVILNEIDDVWKKSELKEIRSNSNNILYYTYLEPSCEALYIISDGCFRFIQKLDTSTMKSADMKKNYCWSQTQDDITVMFKLSKNVNMDCLCVDTKPTEISIKIGNQVILNGKLCYKIDDSLTNWSIENNVLEIRLSKQAEGHLWTSFIEGDDSGEYLIDTALTTEIHDKLNHLCSENEVISPLGTTFNSQEVEECDFEEDKYTNFERLSRITYEVTHKVNINTHTLVLTVEKHTSLPPALALRHDVDAYVWQPLIENEHFTFTHEGTLNAFGYVQASKQQRKFSVCAPDLSYCAVCETSRHLFIYRQQKTINGGELRNRSTGKKIGSIAQQQVVNLDEDEILGIYAAQSKLILLAKQYVYILKL